MAPIPINPSPVSGAPATIVSGGNGNSGGVSATPTPQYNTSGGIIPVGGSSTGVNVGLGTPTPENNSTPAPQVVNPVTGGSNSQTTPSGGPADPYGNPLNEEDAYTQELGQAQTEISGITAYYNNLLNQDAVQNQQATDATRAMNLASGVAGGGAAAANQGSTTTQNNNRTAATTAQMAAALESIYSTISSNALTLAQNASANAQDAIKNQQAVSANAIAAAGKIGAAGMSGVLYQNTDPQGFQQLMQQTGLTPLQLISTINASVPAAYQPQSQTHYAPAADGSTQMVVTTSQLNPVTGVVTLTNSQPITIPIPWTSFNQNNVLQLQNGDYGYVNAQGQLIDLSTGNPYVPTAVVAAGSSVTPTTGAGGDSGGGAAGGGASGGDTSWIPQGFAPGTSTSTQANNNPGAIMAANGTVPAWASAIDPNATVGSDGQVQFSSPALGVQAMQANLNSSAYSDLTLDKALQQWTGSTGYGANSTTTAALLKQFNLDPNAKVSDIMKTNPTALTNAIMQGEGSIAPSSSADSGVSPLITGNNVSWSSLGIDAKGASTLQGLNYTPQGIYQMAFQSLISDSAPSGGSMGVIGSIIKGGFATVQNSILKAYGLSQSDIPAIQAVSAGTNTALGTMIQQKASITQYITKTNANLGTLQSVISQYGDTSSPLVNEALQAIQNNVTGDAKLTGLTDALTPFLNEYSKVMQGSTGSASGATVNSQQEAASLLSTLMNKGQLQEGISVMVQDMAGQINSVNSNVGSLTQDAANIIGQYAISKGSTDVPAESFAPATFTIGSKSYVEGDAVPITNNGQTSLYTIDGQGNLTPMQ
jgi:hypothetical protein